MWVRPSVHPSVHASVRPSVFASVGGWLGGWVGGWVGGRVDLLRHNKISHSQKTNKKEKRVLQQESARQNALWKCVCVLFKVHAIGKFLSLLLPHWPAHKSTNNSHIHEQHPHPRTTATSMNNSHICLPIHIYTHIYMYTSMYIYIYSKFTVSTMTSPFFSEVYSKPV